MSSVAMGLLLTVLKACATLEYALCCACVSSSRIGASRILSLSGFWSPSRAAASCSASSIILEGGGGGVCSRSRRPCDDSGGGGNGGVLISFISATCGATVGRVPDRSVPIRARFVCESLECCCGVALRGGESSGCMSCWELCPLRSGFRRAFFSGDGARLSRPPSTVPRRRRPPKPFLVGPSNQHAFMVSYMTLAYPRRRGRVRTEAVFCFAPRRLSRGRVSSRGDAR